MFLHFISFRHIKFTLFNSVVFFEYKGTVSDLKNSKHQVYSDVIALSTENVVIIDANFLFLSFEMCQIIKLDHICSFIDLDK